MEFTIPEFEQKEIVQLQRAPQVNMSEHDINQHESLADITQAERTQPELQTNMLEPDSNQHKLQMTLSEPECNHDHELQAEISQFEGKLLNHYDRLTNQIRRVQSVLKDSVAHLQKLECELDEELSMFEDEK